jgi:hypothetical protein
MVGKIVSFSKFDVILVNVDRGYKTKLMMLLTEPSPYPQLSRQNSAMVLVNIPSIVVSCVDLKEAVLLELLIELAGGTVDIRHAKQCD